MKKIICGLIMLAASFIELQAMGRFNAVWQQAKGFAFVVAERGFDIRRERIEKSSAMVQQLREAKQDNVQDVLVTRQALSLVASTAQELDHRILLTDEVDERTYFNYREGDAQLCINYFKELEHCNRISNPHRKKEDLPSWQQKSWSGHYQREIEYAYAVALRSFLLRSFRIMFAQKQCAASVFNIDQIMATIDTTEQALGMSCLRGIASPDFGMPAWHQIPWEKTEKWKRHLIRNYLAELQSLNKVSDPANELRDFDVD